MVEKAGREISRAERHEKQNRGFTPAYQTKEFEEGSVVFSNRRLFEKNMALMKNLCNRCREFLRKNMGKSNGAHCRLKGNCCK